MKSAASWIALSAALVLTGCGGANARITPVSGTQTVGPAGDYPMVLGDPFVVDGTTYTPVDVMNYDSVGYASVATGEGVSGAHRTLPLPSYVEVTSLESGRTILVRMTERGPMQGRDLVSLSSAAWAQLGAAPSGRVPVRVRRVNPPEAERALLRSGGQVPARMDTPNGLLAVLKRKLDAGGPTPAPMATPSAASTPSPVAAIKTTPPAPAAVPVVRPAVPAPVAVPAKSTAAAPAAPSKGLFVQVGAYSSKARAHTVASAVGGSATPVGKLWRVRTGPHQDRGQADLALAKVRSAGYADAKVVTAP